LLLYYISDRAQFRGDEKARRRRLLEKIQEAGAAGVDFIQLREKDLSGRELEMLSRDALQLLENTSTGLLINSRSDIALACGAHGVHLRSEDVSVADARRVAVGSSNWLVFASCHSENDIARAHGADFAVFAPVFQKQGAQPAGIAKLRAACQHDLPVIALGGVSVANARECVEAGAAGVAGIRLFQENAIADVVKVLRG
jgi:thiamine-phosphate pyrophosphorylase